MPPNDRLSLSLSLYKASCLFPTPIPHPISGHRKENPLSTLYIVALPPLNQIPHIIIP